MSAKDPIIDIIRNMVLELLLKLVIDNLGIHMYNSEDSLFISREKLLWAAWTVKNFGFIMN